jgi:hypothetical protein
MVTIHTTFYNNKKLRIFPTVCIYGFCMTLFKQSLFPYLALSNGPSWWKRGSFEVSSEYLKNVCMDFLAAISIVT